MKPTKSMRRVLAHLRRRASWARDLRVERKFTSARRRLTKKEVTCIS